MSDERPLTPQMRRFVEAYPETWVATDAARAAGYKWPVKAAWRLMKDDRIRAAINQRLEEAAMPANELLARLAQQARVNMGDFIIIRDGVDPKTGIPERRIEIDWDLVKARGYLVKEISYSRSGQPQIKLVDNQKALELLAKHLGLLTENIDMHLKAEIEVDNVRENILRKLAGIETPGGAGEVPTESH